MPNLNCEILGSIEEIGSKQWNDTVFNSKIKSFFHRYEWLYSIEKGLDVEPKHIVVNKNGTPIAIFPNFITKVPKMPLKRLYSIDPGYGGPIILKHEKDVLEMIFGCLPKICKGNVMSHYLRFYDPYLIRYTNLLLKNDYKSKVNSRFYFDLHDNLPEIMSNMSKYCRKNISRGKKNNYEIIEESIDKESMNRFYESFKLSMEKVQGYVYPYDFFKCIGETFSDEVKIFSIYIDDEYCGGNLFIMDKVSSIVYAFFSGVCEKDFSIYPNYILDMHMLDYCYKNGFLYYDLGPTEGDFDDGLFMHKSRYGTKILPMLSWEKTYSKPSKMTYDLARSIFYKLNLHR